MRSIFKYVLARVPRQILTLPDGAQILSVDRQFENLVLWAAVDPERPVVRRVFHTALTGEDVPDNGEHLATVKFNDGAFIVHVFEVPL